MTKFVVIDDFLPLSYQNHLEKIFYEQTHGNIYSFSGLTSGGATELKMFQEAIPDYEIKESPQLVCVTLGGNEVMHQTWFDIRPLTWFLEMHTGIQIQAINRCKVNLNPLNESWSNTIHTPHSDVGSFHEQGMNPKNEHYTLIYYIKDADGPTVIFDRTLDDFKYKKMPLSVIGKVEPKKGRAVLLKSDLLHAGTNPVKSDCRIVSNIVFTATHPINLEGLQDAFMGQTD